MEGGGGVAERDHDFVAAYGGEGGGVGVFITEKTRYSADEGAAGEGETSRLRGIKRDAEFVQVDLDVELFFKDGAEEMNSEVAAECCGVNKVDYRALGKPVVLVELMKDRKFSGNFLRVELAWILIAVLVKECVTGFDEVITGKIRVFGVGVLFSLCEDEW